MFTNIEKNHIYFNKKTHQDTQHDRITTMKGESENTTPIYSLFL